ncbi:MAG: substrate-binding domain-containing protein [Gemmatimonadetes bacterium]|nr:substrate-binding domain-containing protein [Gemmatimonadota bacterium]
MSRIAWRRAFGALVFLGPGIATAGEAQTRGDVVLATTTSVRDAGLLEHLLPAFERMTGITVRVLAVGSGQAMALGRRGEADVLILHDPAGEEAFMAEGFGVERYPLMHNYFALVGPRADPAGAREAGGVLEVLARVAQVGALFVSRGDGSGTHVKELELWRGGGIEPGLAWYRETGQGMSATLQVAHELGAYTITDVASFWTHDTPLDLAVLIDDDPALYNPYHIVLPNAERFPWVNRDGGLALAAYLRSREAQTAIGAFRAADGRGLFVPDAAPASGRL